MSFHNRCTISGANGPINLTVPLEGGRTQRSLVNEIRISDREKWQRTHLRGIVSAYNRSPWFEYYYDELTVLFNTHFEYLIDWNMTCLKWVLKCLRSDLEVGFSQEYKRIYDGEGEHDLRGRITPRNPVLFSENGQKNDIIYHQVFEEKAGFIPHLSILDLLFCEGGKRTVSIFKREEQNY